MLPANCQFATSAWNVTEKENPHCSSQNTSPLSCHFCRFKHVCTRRISISAAKLPSLQGANSGIGLGTARQLLLLNTATVILAVRNVEKGEAARSILLADKDIQASNRTADARVMKLDMADYQSVWEFANSVKTELSSLHILILNAAVANLPWRKTSGGHDEISQVNYLPNALLLLELLPHLEATAQRMGEPSRLTWVGSRSFLASKLAFTIRVEMGESVVDFLGDPKNYG